MNNYNITVEKVITKEAIYYKAKVDEFSGIVEYGESEQEAYDIALEAATIFQQYLEEEQGRKDEVLCSNSCAGNSLCGNS